MTRRITRTECRRRGRPSRLTEQVAERIVSVVEDGNHLTTACAAAGVSRAALYRWLAKADEVDAAIDQGEPYDADKLAFRDFRDRLNLARARAEMNAVSVIRQCVVGWFVISEEPVLDRKRRPIRDDAGSIIWKRRYAPPDGRLAIAYLARARPEVWGQNPTERIELTDDHPTAVRVEPGPLDSEEHIAQLAQRLALVAQRHRTNTDESDSENNLANGEVYGTRTTGTL